MSEPKRAIYALYRRTRYLVTCFPLYPIVQGRGPLHSVVSSPWTIHICDVVVVMNTKLVGLGEHYAKDVGVAELKNELEDYRALTAEEISADTTWLRLMNAHEEPARMAT